MNGLDLAVQRSAQQACLLTQDLCAARTDLQPRSSRWGTTPCRRLTLACRPMGEEEQHVMDYQIWLGMR